MDDRRFDDLAKTLAAVRSRRGILRALGLVLGGGAVATIGLGGGDGSATVAPPTPTFPPGCRPGGSICRKAGECCSGACTPDATGRGRCGCEANTTPCGVACCTPGQLCVNGVCRQPTATATATNTPTSTPTNTPTNTPTSTPTNTPVPTSLTCNPTLISGPPAQAINTFRDQTNGIVSIVVTRSENADTVVPPFIPGTTDPVVVTSTKIDQTQFARVTILVTDGAGNVLECDFTIPAAPVTSCPGSTTFVAGPPAQAVAAYQDPDGIVSIVVTRSENADTVVPPFIPGTTDPVMVTSTKIDQSKLAAVEVVITDGPGNVEICETVF